MPRLSPSRLNMEDGRIDRAALKDWAETAVGVSANVFSGTSYTVNIENGTTVNVVLSADCSFIFQNPTGSGNACSFTLILKQGSRGGFVVSWPGAVYWQGGVNPVLGKTPGDFDIFEFSTLDGGAKWFGSVVQRDRTTSLGTLWAWGVNTFGQLGNDSAGASVSSPTQIGTLANWAQMAVAGHSAALKSDGTLWTWGDNGFGQLGQSTAITLDRSSPVQVGTLSDWANVAVGGDHTIALKTDGTIWTWGRNTNGQQGANLGTTAHRSSPVQVGALATWATVSAGAQNSFATKTDGSMWIWGDNALGQLGLNTAITADVSSPTQLGTLTDWASARMGYQFTFARKTDGSIWSWGENINGKLGLNNILNTSSPVQVGTDTSWSTVSPGTDHVVALKTDGSLWTWGVGTGGRLGRSSTASSSSPVQVGTLTDWALATCAATSVAIKVDGTLWAWGTGTNGANGQNSTANSSSPAQVGASTKWMNADATQGQQILATQFP